jgi:phospholipid-binding lipoprotein MlaA
MAILTVHFLTIGSMPLFLRTLIGSVHLGANDLVMTFIQRIRLFLTLSCVAFAFATNPVAKAEYRDPLENINRVVFEINDTVDGLVLRPVAVIYRDLTPRFVKKGVGNFFHNLREPTIMLNDFFQGKNDAGVESLVRGLVNTTIGVAGVLDIGEEMGFEKHDNDFGLTLAHHGFGPGAYLVVPFYGPTTTRDFTGALVDTAINPWTYVTVGGGSTPVIEGISRRVLNTVHGRHLLIDELDTLKESSVDYYSSIKSFYEQGREQQVTGRQKIQSRGGKGDDDIYFDDED